MTHLEGERLFEREADFITWLAGLMDMNPSFSQVALEPLLRGDLSRERRARARPDIMAVRSRAGRPETLIIECKNRPIYGGAINEAIAQLRRYGELQFDARLVLAVPGRLADVDRARLRDFEVEPWDLDAIVRTFRDQIGSGPANLAMLATALPAQEAPEEVFLRELRECPVGKAGWADYQKLIGRILEHCFCPPLNAPLSESPDASGVNRRDFVLANFADGGFWSALRSRYAADYVVVDAKNYAGKVKKRDVLQLANYLKSHGAGLFGIIFSRNGGDNSASVTAREHWAHYQKMVVVLDDQQCQAIINGVPTGEAALVLAKAIQDFRLAM